ncbi:MAG: hypothetical protein U9O64_10425 [Campylobacterota bacterium]|nr:hypothetical protein [Campylobacterota bacterium]
MNMQDISDECTKKFLERIKEKMEAKSSVPSHLITKYCRMRTIYCESEGKVSKSFVTAMDKCIQEIISIEGMEDIMNEYNKCPDNS